MPDLKQFTLPDVGEGLTEAEIVKWHVAAGDSVEVNQTIVEIETAKAIVELPCPFEGVVTKLHVAEGETVDVGTPIISVDIAPGGSAPASFESQESVESPAARGDVATTATGATGAGAAESGAHSSLAPQTQPEASEQKRQPVLVGYGVKPGATQRRARRSGHAAAQPAPAGTRQAHAEAPAAIPAAIPVPVTAGTPTGLAARAESRGRVVVLAKPPVRKMARELGVDLATIIGSGPQGSVTRADVQSAVAAPATGPVADTFDQGVREERIRVKGVRRHMAAAMVASAFTAPHVTEFLQVDATETMVAVRRLRELPDFTEVKVSPLLLVAKALLTAVRRHPMINSAWDEAAQEIVVKHYVNLGIAAATDRGLIVPNIKDAQALSLPALAKALQELTETARAGRAQPADLSGGTMTITNVGVFGVDAGTPIITPGESAILAFGQIRDLPWVHEGEIRIRKVTTLALSFDHRIVDGELGSMFLRDLGAMLEDPLRMLAWN